VCGRQVRRARVGEHAFELEILGAAYGPADVIEVMRRPGLDADHVRLDDPGANRLARRRTGGVGVMPEPVRLRSAVFIWRAFAEMPLK
jgi:hypothetical protein